MDPVWYTMNVHQPYRKASQSPYRTRKNTYCPPGSAISLAISAFVRAPASVRSPVRTQTAIMIPGICITAATRWGVRKIPDPMTEPITTAAAEYGPSLRESVSGVSTIRHHRVFHRPVQPSDCAERNSFRLPKSPNILLTHPSTQPGIASGGMAVTM